MAVLVSPGPWVTVHTAGPPGGAGVAVGHRHGRRLVAGGHIARTVVLDQVRDHVHVPVPEYAEDDLGALGGQRIRHRLGTGHRIRSSSEGTSSMIPNFFVSSASAWMPGRSIFESNGGSRILAAAAAGILVNVGMISRTSSGWACA